MIHYMARISQKVVPIKDADGKVIGNVVIHQIIGFDTHIESDTAFLDPSGSPDVPFTVYVALRYL